MSVVGDISLPGNLQCPTHGLLSDYVLGRLDDDHFALFSQHIESCSNCQETVAAMDCLEDSFVRRLKRDCHGSQVAMSPELERWLEAAEAINDLVGRQSRNGNQAAEELPRLLGQYLLVERLGNGGMGVVYKAQHMKLKCWVALKILAPGLSLDSRSLARFHREMAAVAALNHPHIVRATDANEVGGQHFLVMEYVDGVDLAKIVRLLGPLCVPDACEVIRQAALALQHAHEAGVVHRDVKPSNLMLTSTGLVKLLDLGLARLTVNAHESEGPNTDTGQVLGTADFMAPEQALDPRSADARSDLYSLGCTLYYLLTGTAPFNAPAFDTVMKKLLAHAAAPVPLIGHRRPDVPTPIETILDRLLAKRPACRFNAARELADALQPSVHGADLLGLYRRFTTVAAADCAAQSRALVDPLSGYQVTRRPTKPRRRLRHGVTMATVFGLLVSGGICWLGWQNFLTDRAKDEPSGGGAALGVDDASDSSEQGAAELATFLGHANLPEGLRAAMLATLRQHPRARQWAGQDQGLMFALAARPLPKGDVRPAAVSPLLGTVHMVCIHELLSAKAFIDYYAAEGLTDATALRAGLLALANEISVNGRAWGVLHRSQTQGNFGVAYVYADASQLTASLRQPANLAKVRIAYRDTLHEQLRALSKQSRWADAIRLWQHLHERRLLSPELCLDAASCLRHLKKPQDALAVLQEAFETYAASVSADWLEQCGDLALQLGKEGEPLAEKAFKKASERLLYIKTSAPAVP